MTGEYGTGLKLPQAVRELIFESVETRERVLVDFVPCDPPSAVGELMLKDELGEYYFGATKGFILWKSASGLWHKGTLSKHYKRNEQ